MFPNPSEPITPRSFRHKKQSIRQKVFAQGIIGKRYWNRRPEDQKSTIALYTSYINNNNYNYIDLKMYSNIYCSSGAIFLAEKPTQHTVDLTINGNHVTTVLIGRHYLLKHSSYMNDALILDLVTVLDGQSFPESSGFLKAKNLKFWV